MNADVQPPAGPGPRPAILLRPVINEDEFPVLVEVWRSAVDATHDFVEEADLWEIEAMLAAAYLPNARVTVAEVDGRPVGFTGTADGRLEMMFVHNDHRHHGVGSALLDHVIREESVVELEVNEQNQQALGFYLAHGFEVSGRRDVDDAGRPSPLLHLTLRSPSISARPDRP